MQMYQSLAKILCPLAAIAAVASAATPGISQVQFEDANSRPSRSEPNPSETIQVRPVELEEDIQDTFIAVPVEPEAADEELPADDPWVTFCLINSDPGEDLANCLDGLP